MVFWYSFQKQVPTFHIVLSYRTTLLTRLYWSPWNRKTKPFQNRQTNFQNLIHGAHHFCRVVLLRNVRTINLRFGATHAERSWTGLMTCIWIGRFVQVIPECTGSCQRARESQMPRVSDTEKNQRCCHSTWPAFLSFDPSSYTEAVEVKDWTHGFGFGSVWYTL